MMLQMKNGYPTVQREFMRNVIEAGYSSVVIPLAIPANIGAKFLGYLMDRELSPMADLIFIDANHDYDDVKADIANYFPLLSPSGLMFGDDYSWPGVRKAVHEFAARHNLEVFSPNNRTWFMA
jgi:predicted O-methyltransferase YrrM